MRTRQYQSIHENPHILRAVVVLRKSGMEQADVLRALRMSRATYFKCLRAIREARERAERDRA